MENFEYYEVIDDGVVFVRERSTDFFAIYSPYTKKWCQPDNITFMELTHDRDYMAISKEEALKKTNESALESLFREYISLIKNNT
ncbi:MAG: hypothetical protein J6S23_07570 [Clostridia bacterium]|nr:hypothetical protein [Clostridia bacterium]